MANASDKIRVFENVMARVGLDGDFLGEYFKGLSAINGLQTMAELTPPPPIASNMADTPQLDQSGATLPPTGDNGLGGLKTPSNGI